MWRNPLPVVAAGLLATLAATTAVSADALGAPAAAPAGDTVEKLFSDYQGAMFKERFSDALVIAQTIQVEPDNKKGRAILAAMRASALLGLNRDKEARKLIAESDGLAPQIPDPSATLLLGALLTKHFDVAADVLDRMIARYPDAVRDIDRDAMSFFMINAPKGQDQRNHERLIALARLGYGGDTENGHYLVERALNLLVSNGDWKGAADLLPDVKEPVLIENMLIQKRFSPLWPQIEQVAGPHLSTVRSTAVAAATREYEAAPDDHRALANYVNALRHAGRLNDAIELRSKVPGTTSAMSSVDEQMGWTINNIALAMFEAGRREEADQLFESLNDAPMPKEYWRVSMKINRLELLVGEGRLDRALPLIEPTAQTEGTPYANQLVRRLRYCALKRFGRAAEAEKYKPDLLAHASDAPGPTVDGFLCAGDVDGAEQVALAALRNPDADKRQGFETDFVRLLQAHLLTSDYPTTWQERWAELRKRPAVAAAFDRLGRDMPKQFLAEPSH